MVAGVDCRVEGVVEDNFLNMTWSDGKGAGQVGADVQYRKLDGPMVTWVQLLVSSHPGVSQIHHSALQVGSIPKLPAVLQIPVSPPVHMDPRPVPPVPRVPPASSR